MKKNILLFSALALLVGACSSSTVGDKTTLVVGVPMEAVSLDPFASRDNPSSWVRGNIFDRLIERDEQGEFSPSLATEWKYVSPTVFELKLREGVLFHNGEAFSAKDVKYSLERLKASPDMFNIGAPIRSVDIVDDYTVRINLNQVFAPFEAYLTHVSVAMMNEKAVIDAGENISAQPVGTGPYKFVSWNRGQDVTLVRNADYWGGEVPTENVIFRIIPEGSARTIALETGEVDVIYAVDSTDRDRLSSDNRFTLIERNTPRIDYLGFNLGPKGNPIWKDVRVRKAAALAIDNLGIINSVMFGAASPAGSLLEASVFGATNISPLARDMAQAKELIAQANLPVGAKAVIWTPSGYRQKIAEIIQANLKEIGIDVSIEVLEWGRYIASTANGDQDLFILGWTTVSLDADEGLYDILHSGAWGSAGNRSFYANPQVDSLLAQARIELDVAKREELYRQVQVIASEDVAMIPMFYPYEIVGMKKSVKNFGYNLVSIHRLGKTYTE
ncbi:MAG: ABC transporter substrate-binding protein [Brevinema sp.]